MALGASGCVFGVAAAASVILPFRRHDALHSLVYILGADVLRRFSGFPVDAAAHIGGALFGLFFCRELIDFVC